MNTKVKMPAWAFIETSHNDQPASAPAAPFAAIFDELAFLSSDDCDFLGDIFTRFPRVGSGFNHFVGCEPEERLAEAVHKLKSEPRAGWPLLGVPREMIQSVAGHHADTMKMAFMIAAQNIDPAHIARMMAVHDLAESVTGDFVSGGRFKDAITKPEKQRLERIAMRMLLQDFPNEDASREIKALWEEYEDGKTANAIMAHDIDKLELVMQAQYYTALYPDLKPQFSDMWHAAHQGVKTPEGRAWLDELTQQTKPHTLKTQNRAVFTFPWDL